MSFFTPKPGLDGLRRYNVWAGNPKGCPEDTSRCIEQVHGPGRGCDMYQCRRKRGHGPDGLYCKTHDPKSVEERHRKSEAAYHAKYIAPYERAAKEKKAKDERIAELEAENGRLRKVIEDAPHDSSDPCGRGRSLYTGPCVCWKSRSGKKEG